MMMMIEIVVSTGVIKVLIPRELMTVARDYLPDLWREEFAGQREIILELTENIKRLVERYKYNRYVLVRV